MSRSERNGKAARRANAGSSNNHPSWPLALETTTESLAAAAGDQLSSIERQLARFAGGSNDARPYEAFDSEPRCAAPDQSLVAFEYDGQCPLQTPLRSRPATPPLYAHLFATDDPSKPRENTAAFQPRQRSLPDDGRSSVQDASQIAAEVETAFQKLSRLFGSDAAHQFRLANQRLHEARSLFEEIRRLHAAARDILREIEQIRTAVSRA